MSRFKKSAEGSAKLRSYVRIVEEVRGYFRQFVPTGVGLVDELIVERKVEVVWQ